MLIEILEQSLEPWQKLADYQVGRHGAFGATAVFVGTMRDFNLGDDVQTMHLEHYPEMTQKYLEQLASQASEKWDILDVVICHRVGEIKPGDSIVLLATWSAHRADAYEANRWLMESLKSKAPFWKKETLSDNSTRWVEKNTPG